MGASERALKKAPEQNHPTSRPDTHPPLSFLFLSDEETTITMKFTVLLSMGLGLIPGLVAAGGFFDSCSESKPNLRPRVDTEMSKGFGARVCSGHSAQYILASWARPWCY